MISKNDVLICVRNGSRNLVGKAAIVDKNGMAFGAFMAKISSPLIDLIFLYIQSLCFIQSLVVLQQQRLLIKLLKNDKEPINPSSTAKRAIANYQRRQMV